MERRHAPWLKTLKELVKQKAESLNMPAPVLAQARTLESLGGAAAAGKLELPEELRGWRETVVGSPLMSELQRLVNA